MRKIVLAMLLNQAQMLNCVEANFDELLNEGEDVHIEGVEEKFTNLFFEITLLEEQFSELIQEQQPTQEEIITALRHFSMTLNDDKLINYLDSFGANEYFEAVKSGLANPD